MITKYHEIHISVDIGASSMPALRELCHTAFRPNKVHVSQIVGDEPDVIVTTRADLFAEAEYTISTMLKVLKDNGWRVTRYKIEAALLDEREV